MRQFQKILLDLKDVVRAHLPGEELLPPPSLSTIEIKGRRLAYVSAGEERDPLLPPIVLMHGFGGFFMDWPRVMAQVSRHTRVVAFDLPGWGFSEPNFEASSMEDDVEVLSDFLTKLNLENAMLCGISYGAGVAWAAASMGLERVQRAVLLNPMPTHPLRFLNSPIYKAIFLLNSAPKISNLGHSFMRKEQYKLICRENLLNDRLLDSFYLDLAYLVIKQPKMPFMLQAHARGAREVDWADWEKRLSNIRMPVSILQAEQDRIFNPKSARHLHNLIPTSELIEVPDCGHAMVFDQHRKVGEFLIKCLNEKHLRTSQESHLKAVGGV